ncbi:MAG: hypothetical protein CMI29_08420 [Opitutae bacterium]|nr:hypothetical protein [Opitutae bacterium]
MPVPNEAHSTRAQPVPTPAPTAAAAPVPAPARPLPFPPRASRAARAAHWPETCLNACSRLGLRLLGPGFKPWLRLKRDLRTQLYLDLLSKPSVERVVSQQLTVMALVQPGNGLPCVRRNTCCGSTLLNLAQLLPRELGLGSAHGRNV